MKQSIDINQFREAFKAYNRQDNFSHEGLKALFGYLEDYEFVSGVEIELDVISLCCEYTKYTSLEEVQENYNIESMEDLQNHTTVIEFDGGFIIQDY